MAEENAAAQNNDTESKPSGQKPTLFIILAVVNMVIVLGVGVMLYMGQQKADQEDTIDGVINGAEQAIEENKEDQNFIGQLIPLETFLVNLSGSKGQKLIKINMELEVDEEQVQAEIEKLKPKIRDIIIVILSSKTYSQVSTKSGKDNLREEIKDQVNLFLTKGEIKKVYFTELLYN